MSLRLPSIFLALATVAPALADSDTNAKDAIIVEITRLLASDQQADRKAAAKLIAENRVKSVAILPALSESARQHSELQPEHEQVLRLAPNEYIFQMANDKSAYFRFLALEHITARTVPNSALKPPSEGTRLVIEKQKGLRTIRKFIDDPDGTVAAHAIDSWDFLKPVKIDDAMIVKLINLFDDERRNERNAKTIGAPSWEAADALGKCGPEVLPFLIEALKSESLRRRVHAASVFSSRLQSKEVTNVLLELAKDPNETLQRNVIRAFANATELDADVVNTLLQLANEKNSHTVNYSLSHLAGRAGMPTLKIMIPFLLEQCRDPIHADVHMVQTLTTVMSRLSPPEKEQFVHDLLVRTTNEDGRISTYLLGPLAAAGKNAHEALPTLLKMFESSEADERFKLAMTLWKVEGNAERVLPVIMLSIDPQKPSMSQYYGFRALQKMGPAASPAVPDLIKIIENADRENRRSRRFAIKTLLTIGPAARPAIDLLKTVAKEEDTFVAKVAREVIEALQATDNPKAE
jgi:HEAT repeat protein